MQSCPRGYLLIIDNRNFTNISSLQDRLVSQVDCENLQHLFQEILGFEVDTKVNLKAQVRVIIYCQTSNISHTLVGNKIVYHSDVVGASLVGAGFNGLGKDNYKTRWETFKFWYLVQLILEVWQ